VIQGQPAAVSSFFEADAANWDACYERHDVFSVIHQLRLSRALAWVDELRLPPAADVLEVGCGTGLLAIELARRGLRVTAVDAAVNMLARAEVNVAAAGLGESVALMRGDVECLPLPSSSVRLVVALGLVPWIPRPRAGLGEMVRVLAPGGHLIVNCDNSRRLSVLLDPRYSPATRGPRSVVGRLRAQAARAGGNAVATRHSIVEFDELLANLGAPVVRGQTFGFGPFTMGGREALPGPLGVSLHRGLQRLADRGLPGVRSTGAQYMVQAVKS